MADELRIGLAELPLREAQMEHDADHPNVQPLASGLALAGELQDRSSVVVACLDEIDPVITHDIHQAMFLGDPPRPRART